MRPTAIIGDTDHGGQQRGNDVHLCHVRLRRKGVATAVLYNILNRCAAVAWVGSSGGVAAAESPGAQPLRARQGYAGGLAGDIRKGAPIIG